MAMNVRATVPGLSGPGVAFEGGQSTNALWDSAIGRAAGAYEQALRPLAALTATGATGRPGPSPPNARISTAARPGDLAAALRTWTQNGTATVGQKRFLLHLATPEGQSQLKLLNGFDATTLEQATQRIGTALRRLALLNPDPAPPEIAVTAYLNPQTGRFQTTQELHIGNYDMLHSGQLGKTPRFNSTGPDNTVVVHTHPVLGSSDRQGYKVGVQSGLSTGDIRFHDQAQAALAPGKLFTTASVDTLTGQVTSVTGPKKIVRIWAQGGLNDVTTIGSLYLATADLIARAVVTDKFAVLPPGTHDAYEAAVQRGYRAAENTTEANRLAEMQFEHAADPLFMALRSKKAGPP